MQRNGTVAAINPKRGMVAIATEDNDFTIIELLSEFELDIDDSVSWLNGYGLGHEIYKNLTKGSNEEVYVQNHGVNRANLRKQLLLEK
jgi:hypothetical protein